MDIRICLVILTAILSSGCATIFADGSDTITIKTEPSGAEIYDGINRLGTTPLTQEFNRDTFKHKKLQIRKEGYKTYQLPLGRTLEPVALFNFGFFLTTGGATSWGIDALSGAMIQYDPASYFIDLESEGKDVGLKDSQRRSQIYFVLKNFDSIRRDIAKGEGEYLSSYFSLLERAEGYDLFLNGIEGNSSQILVQEDGVDLYRHMATY